MMRSSCCSAFLLRGSQLSRANSSPHAELFSIDMLPVSARGLRMVAAANLVEVAALVSDTARATMLDALMGGQVLTATELAYCASISSSSDISCAPDGSGSGNELRLVGGDRFDFAIGFGAVNRALSAATAPSFPSATIQLSATHFCYSHPGLLRSQWGNARSWCRRFHPRNRTRDRP
jgi:hypothetical protein